LPPHILPPVPEPTAAAVQAAFPKGYLYVDLRAEVGTLSHAQLLADLYSPAGRPVEVPPWRLARGMVRQDSAGLTDRQAAAAVRRCLAWQYALRLAWHAPGFACPLCPDLRQRWRAHAAAPRRLAPFLATCKARGGIKARGPPRTDAPHGRAALRPLHRVEGGLEARP